VLPPRWAPYRGRCASARFDGIHLIARDASFREGTSIGVGEKERIQNRGANARPRSRCPHESNLGLIERVLQLGKPVGGEDCAVGVQKAEAIVIEALDGLGVGGEILNRLVQVEQTVLDALELSAQR
jgi:hypothetical protein